jgi:hypothetical protein
MKSTIGKACAKFDNVVSHGVTQPFRSYGSHLEILINKKATPKDFYQYYNSQCK